MKFYSICLLLIFSASANAHAVPLKKSASKGSSEAVRVARMTQAMKIAWGDHPVDCRDASYSLPGSIKLYTNTRCDINDVPGMPRGGFCDSNSGTAPAGKFDCWLTYQSEPNQNPSVFAAEEAFLSPNGALIYKRR